MLAPTPLLRPGPMDIGALFAGAFDALKRRFGLFVLIALFPSLVGFILIGAGVGITVASAVAAAAGNRGLPAGLFVGFAVIFLAIVATALAQLKSQAMLSVGAYEIAQGQHPDFRGLLSRTRGFLPRMAAVIAIAFAAILVVYGLIFGVSLAMVGALDGRSGGGAAALAGILFLLILALVPFAIFLQVKLLYTIPATAIEQVGGIDGMKRSWQLTRGAFWRTFGYYFVAGLAVAAVSYAIGLVGQVAMMPMVAALQGINRSSDPAQVIAAMSAALPVYLLVVVLQVAVQLVAQPFLHAYTTYMFIDQVRRSETPPAPAYGSGFTAPGPYYAPPGQYYQPGQQPNWPVPPPPHPQQPPQPPTGPPPQA